MEKGTEVENRLHLFDVGLSYQASPCWSLSLSAPIMTVDRISHGPGFMYARGRDIWSVSVPIAIDRNRTRSVSDIEQGRHRDAAFADYLILIGYSRTF